MPPAPPQPSSPQPTANFNPTLLVIGLVLSGLGGLAPLLLVPRYAPVFAVLSIDLPPLTQTLVEHPWLLCPLPVPVWALWMLWPKRRRDLAALLFGGIAGISAVALTLIATYLPFLELARTF